MKRKTVTPAADPSAVRRALGYVESHDVAALLGITTATLKNRLSIGTAPPTYKVGNRHLFKASGA